MQDGKLQLMLGIDVQPKISRDAFTKNVSLVGSFFFPAIVKAQIIF